MVPEERNNSVLFSMIPEEFSNDTSMKDHTNNRLDLKKLKTNFYFP